MKEKALVICPGRGTYNAAELGYLQRFHGGGGAFVERLDALRRETGQPTITQLDSAEKFVPSRHLTGDNASLLIYACAMADFAAIDRERFDIVAVTGNSMGWYLALICAGILEFDAGARLVNNMGTLMHGRGTGGQIVWSLCDDDWRMTAAKEEKLRQILAQAADEDRGVHISIRLGGMIVFAGDDAALTWLMANLPRDDRFPMRINHHAAFHSPLLRDIIPAARAQNSPADFGGGAVAAIDGGGKIWAPKAFDPAAIYDYTLGAQISQTYDFSRAVQVAAFEYMPDRVILLGPGTTLGAPTAQALIASGWRGLTGKADFLARQNDDPILLSCAIDAQRTIALGRM